MDPQNTDTTVGNSLEDVAGKMPGAVMSPQEEAQQQFAFSGTFPPEPPNAVIDQPTSSSAGEVPTAAAPASSAPLLSSPSAPITTQDASGNAQVSEINPLVVKEIETAATDVNTAPAVAAPAEDTTASRLPVWDADPRAVRIPLVYGGKGGKELPPWAISPPTKAPANGTAAVEMRNVTDNNTYTNNGTNGIQMGAVWDPNSPAFADTMPVMGYIVALPFTDGSGNTQQQQQQYAPQQQQQVSINPQWFAQPFLTNVYGIPQTECCSYCNQALYSSSAMRQNGHKSRLNIVNPTASYSFQDGLAAPPIHSLDGELFRPCLCPSYIHRGCFRRKRAGLSVLKNSDFYECPTCMFSYKIERIMGGMKASQRAEIAPSPYAQHPSNSNTTAAAGAMMNLPTAPPQPNAMGTDNDDGARRRGELRAKLDEMEEGANVKWIYIRKILFTWIATILAFAASIAVIGGIAYAIDGDDKNVPVLIRLLLTSVVFELPSEEEQDQWRADYRRDDVMVWYFYGALGLFVVSCLLIVGLVAYYICFAGTGADGGDVRPPIASYFCCEEDKDAVLYARRAHQEKFEEGLPPHVVQAVRMRQDERAYEISTYYEQQKRWFHLFSCSRPTSYQYRDQRVAPPKGAVTELQYEYQHDPRFEAQRQREKEEREQQQQQQQNRTDGYSSTAVRPAKSYSTSGGSVYYSTYYYGYRSHYYYHSDSCCVAACCCPDGRHHEDGRVCGSCSCCGGGGGDDSCCGECVRDVCGDGNCCSKLGSCASDSDGGLCGDSDDNNCNCNCSGGGCSNCGEGALPILLFILLVVIIIIIVSAVFGLIAFMITRTFRLSSEAAQLAYIQALEAEEHVFVLGINETWRPLDVV